MRALLALGRVLLAQSGTPAARRDDAVRRDVLGQAQTYLTEALRRAEPGHPWRAQAALELAAVHYGTWHAAGDAEQLAAAERVLRGLDAASLPPEERRTRHLRLGRVLLARAEAELAPRLRAGLAAESVRELRAACEQSEAADVPDDLRAGALLDFAAALRLHGRAQEALEAVRRAQELTAQAPALGERALLVRARTLADAGRAEETDAAYAQVADAAPRDSMRRCEILAEWGERLLDRAAVPAASDATVARAEGVLREAFATVPGRAALFSRLQLALARALLVRYRRGGFPPDRYEAVHLLQGAARRGADAELRAAAWLELGRVHAAELPAGGGRDATEAGVAFRNALREARAAAAGAPSVAVARVLHAQGALLASEGHAGAAREAFAEASSEWRRLVAHLEPVPWDEVDETRRRLAPPTGR
ncbi:hypothetical protein [Streptomyces sp. WMMC897]|uniref:hypothetical protein n=1 Tax=Streptomyces sp. WMMC897 TaxID=3014782 RepID=UPI0022B6D01A|nr:hypothetical protein [Streptomyces sp. WMMC897]MCZ7416581.1 hypothetical protein [Streptomyces sp. WMMC897]